MGGPGSGRRPGGGKSTRGTKGERYNDILGDKQLRKGGLKAKLPYFKKTIAAHYSKMGKAKFRNSNFKRNMKI